MLTPPKFANVVGVIMVVDDDINIMLALKMYLEADGFLCFGATGPDEALAKLRYLQKASIPDLIITDINMPYDGARLIDALGVDPELRHIPILPISADRKDIRGLTVFSKPFNLGDLTKKINELVNTNKKNRAAVAA